MSARKRFNVQLQGDGDSKSNFFYKLGAVKAAMGIGATTMTALDTVMSEWLQKRRPAAITTPTCTGEAGASAAVHYTQLAYRAISSEQAKSESTYITDANALERLVTLANDHGRKCTGDLQLESKSTGVMTKGFYSSMPLKCSTCANCAVYPAENGKWTTSSFLLSGRSLVNERMTHSYYSSGSLPSQFFQVMKEAGLLVSERFIKTLTEQNSYKAVVEQVSNQSIADARVLEVEASPEGIDILTDARHGWRKNSRQTDVVCLGGNTHRVLCLETVTASKDDPVAQRHEKIGTTKIYAALSDLNIKRHCHDNNASITCYVRENQPAVENQLDNWHGLKSLEKLVSTITQGAKKNHGITWHRELEDKAKSLRIHAMYAMRNCNNDSNRLRELLLIPITHYQNDHSRCLPSSRCRSSNYYEPSKIVVTAPKAIELLTKALRNNNMYKKAELYCCNMSTAHVESFNNCLNIFQNKRISFKDNSYSTRSLLTVLHWNENVGRETVGQRVTSTGRQKNDLCEATHTYKMRLWNAYLDRVD